MDKIRIKKPHIKRMKGYWTVTSRVGVLRYVKDRETAYFVAKAYHGYML